MRRRGFTLIEVMVAAAILAMVSTLVWGSFSQTFKTKSEVEAQSGRYRTVRVALERLARELSMAYLSQNEDSSQQDRRTLFAGKHKNGIDEVRFSYYGHQRLYADANECDTAQVAYWGQRNRDDGRKTDLVRRESRRLAYYKIEDQPGESDVVCDDVVALKLEYWDARDKQWREEWVTNAADGQPDRLPSRVKITLTVHDERGKEVPFTTEARIAMQEPLNLRAVDPQQQGQPPPPGTPPKPGGINDPCTAPGSTCAPPLTCKSGVCR
jgi:general secretion pathway protein J